MVYKIVNLYLPVALRVVGLAQKESRASGILQALLRAWRALLADMIALHLRARCVHRARLQSVTGHRHRHPCVNRLRLLARSVIRLPWWSSAPEAGSARNGTAFLPSLWFSAFTEIEPFAGALMAFYFFAAQFPLWLSSRLRCRTGVLR